MSNCNNIFDEIKLKASLEDELEKAGARLARSGSGRMKCCCPLHEENTPSFMLYRGDEYDTYYCWGCVEETEPILTQGGFIPIKDVTVGDYVLGFDGIFSKVTEKTSKGIRNVYNVVLGSSKIPLKLTEDHICFFIKQEDVLFGTPYIRKEKYDLLLDLWSNPRSALITFLSGVKYRVGFAYRGRKYAYNILATSGRGAEHSAEHNLEILKVIEVPVISKKVQFFVSEKDYSTGRNFIYKNFTEGEKIIGIIPAGGWESKRCDAVKWVEICKAISEQYKTKFLILWGPNDEKDAEHIKNHLPELAVLAPKTELPEMTGLIKSCNLIIANDSGPMHISAALGIPTLGIFGPTNPKAHRPYSPNSDYVIKDDLFCIICNKLICPYNHECMLGLPVEKVLEKIEKIGWCSD